MMQILAYLGLGFIIFGVGYLEIMAIFNGDTTVIVSTSILIGFVLIVIFSLTLPDNNDGMP